MVTVKQIGYRLAGGVGVTKPPKNAHTYAVRRKGKQHEIRDLREHCIGAEAQGEEVMAGTPKWKVYSPDGEYIAATRYAEDAAALVAVRGDGATIRWNHGSVVWREGAEKQPAGESYDYVAQTVAHRITKG